MTKTDAEKLYKIYLDGAKVKYNRRANNFGILSKEIFLGRPRVMYKDNIYGKLCLENHNKSDFSVYRKVSW